MSRAPNHLQRLAVQQGMSKLKKRNYSNAIPTDYVPVEITERTALRAMFGEFAQKPSKDEMFKYWDHLAECRNVLMFGAGHMREQTKLRGGDPQVFIDILALCDRVKESMLGIRDREKKTGKFGLSGDDRINLAGLVETSSDFWRAQPAWFFRDCVAAARKVHIQRQQKRAA